MPQEPKKRHSKQRQGKRRNHIKLATAKGVVCVNCQAIILSHKICKQCGYYKNKLVVQKSDKESQQLVTA